MRISKKILAIALSILMAVSMMPFTAFAGTSYGGYVVADGDNGEDLWNKEVYFNDYTWYIIEDNSTSANAGTVTLFCKDIIGESKFSQDTTNNHYSTSTVRTYLDNLTATGSFADVADAIVTIDSLTTNGFQSSEVYDTAENVKLYLLDITEAEDLPFRVRMTANNSAKWWVRSPGGVDTLSSNQTRRAMYVNGTGELEAEIGDFVTATNKVRPALKLDLSKVVFDSSSKTFTLAPAEPTKPTATVTEVPISVVEQYFPGSNLDVAYQFVANNDGDDVYKTYNADFVVSFDKAVPQGAVRLFGQYGNYPLTECPITKDLAANEEYRLLKDAMGMDMTYQQILDLVGTFYCGAQYTAAAAGATMTIKLAIYETAVDPDTGDVTETGTEVEIDDAEQTDTAPALPQATVTDVTNTEENTKGLDKCIKFEAPAGVTAYDDEYCDFVISFDHDVTSKDIELWGNYGEYGWVNLNDEASGDVVTFEAGKNYYLLKDIVKWQMTYAQIRDNVGTFLCGLNCKVGAAGVTTSVELALFEEPAQGEEPVIAQIGDVEEYTAPALPQATVTDITNTEENTLGLDAAYKFEAPDEPSAYDDEYCDFIVRFDHDVTSDDIELWGKYGEYDWTNLASEASGDAYTFEAGKDYYLLRDVIKWPLTYAQIRAIGTFYCGVNSYYGANGTTMDVELALYEEPAQGEEPTPVVIDDEEFVAPEKPAPVADDEVSITTADKVEVNVYLADTGVEKTVEYTFNASPDVEADDQETVTVDFASLPLVNGKRQLTIEVAPAQIKDNIDIDIKNAAGDVIRSYDNYSVAAYCDEIIAGNYAENVKTLAKAVLDYGKAAADFFGYNTGAFANQAYFNTDAFDFANAGVNYVADATLAVTQVRYVAKTVPDLRFEVNIAENVAAGLDVSAESIDDQTQYTAKFAKDPQSGAVLLCVEGIPAAKLDEAIMVSTSAGYVAYTPLAYAKVAATQSNNTKLVKLGNAIGYYWQAANAVFS